MLFTRARCFSELGAGMSAERRKQVEAMVRESREAIDASTADWVAEVDHLFFAFYEDSTSDSTEQGDQEHDRSLEGEPKLRFIDVNGNNVIAAAERFGRAPFAWSSETRAAAAASDEQHTFVLDLSHHVGGNVTMLSLIHISE